MNELNNTDSIENRWEKAKECFRNSDAAGALFLFKSIAKDGETLAYCEIGNIYEFGGYGVEADSDKARYWYKKSLDEADDPYGAYGLGRLFYRDDSIGIDYEKAIWYFDLAANHDIEIANLQLGRIYMSGKDIEKDVNKAEDFFSKASLTGNVYAIKNLGALEIEKGNVFKGVKLYFKGILKHFLLFIKDRRDPRIRSI